MSRKDFSEENSNKTKSKPKKYKIIRDFDKNSYELEKSRTSRTTKEFFIDAGIIVFLSLLISFILAILFGFENLSLRDTVSSYAFFLGALMLIFSSLSALASESPTVQSMNNYFSNALVFLSNPFAARNRVNEQVERTSQQAKDPQKNPKPASEPANKLNIHRNENFGLYVFSAFLIILVAFVV